MIRQSVFFFCMLFSLVVLTSGCETAKGAAMGIGSTVEGAAKDTINLWGGIKRTDQWMRDNLW